MPYIPSMGEFPKWRWCRGCRKFVLACMCAAELSNVSPPVEVGNWRFVLLGDGPPAIEQGDNPHRYLEPYMIFNADSTGTATAMFTASSSAA